MTIKDAILKTLEDSKKMMSYKEIYAYIIQNNLAEFKAKKPISIVSSSLADFIRYNDNTIKRIKKDNGYLYYLSKYENLIDFDNKQEIKNIEKRENKNYKERDLHPLFVTYLKSKNIFAKTIYHEISKQDNNAKWAHPDIIGIEFLELKSKISSKFLKTIDKKNFFSLYSYELKKEIKNDYDLKKSYFQAVSNSSWANYGYLVAMKISDDLLDELQRLNQSFGIGFILLNSNPYETKILFNAQHKELDINTIDKLCKMNKDFEDFIKIIEKYLNANDDYIEITKKEMLGFCDKILNDDEIMKHCKNKNIF
jgi:hypothetical protein